jgi:chromosome segregation ATPase
LLAAVAQNADQLQAAEAHRAELEAALNQFKELAGRRDNLKAEKQVLSRQMRAAGERVVDATIDLKALAKATMGSCSEKLIEFLMAPRPTSQALPL